MKPNSLIVGKITKPHGIKGELVIFPLSDSKQRFLKGKRLSLDTGKSLTLENIRHYKNSLVIKFKDISSRQEAEKLRNKYLEIPLSEAETLPEGSYWHHEIIGLDVFTKDGENLGRIEEILTTGAHDVYVVKSRSGPKGKKEILIPAVKEIIKEVKLGEKRIIINPIPGLIEE